MKEFELPAFILFYIYQLLLMNMLLQPVNDTLYKWIGIPLSGILIFHWAGFSFITGGSMNSLSFHYLYFTAISFIIWHSCGFVHRTVRNHLYGIKELYIRIPLRFAIPLVVSWGFSFILLAVWNHYFTNSLIGPGELLRCQIIITVISIQISSIYEIVYLYRERESDLVKVERSEKLKVQAQLDALKSQIDPHFIFNSLNTLSYLINQDQEKARLFNDTLAKVYRYILLNKEKDLIQLKEEIEFASNYFYLLKIRYQTGLSMVIRMDNISVEDYLIPPLSLQTLIENAIKHNHFSDKKNLDIEITITNESITVLNPRHLKKFDIQSSKIGLSNLNERYSLIVHKNISIQQTPEWFTVTLPILKS